MNIKAHSTDLILHNLELIFIAHKKEYLNPIKIVDMGAKKVEKITKGYILITTCSMKIK